MEHIASKVALKRHISYLFMYMKLLAYNKRFFSLFCCNFAETGLAIGHEKGCVSAVRWSSIKSLEVLFQVEP